MWRVLAKEYIFCEENWKINGGSLISLHWDTESLVHLKINEIFVISSVTSSFNPNCLTASKSWPSAFPMKPCWQKFLGWGRRPPKIENEPHVKILSPGFSDASKLLWKRNKWFGTTVVIVTSLNDWAWKGKKKLCLFLLISPFPKSFWNPNYFYPLIILIKIVFGNW